MSNTPRRLNKAVVKASLRKLRRQNCRINPSEQSFHPIGKITVHSYRRGGYPTQHAHNRVPTLNAAVALNMLFQ